MLNIKACAVSIPPLRAKNEVPLKGNPSKKFNIEWNLSYPDVNFSYTEFLDIGKFTTYAGKIGFDDFLEKNSIKKDENVNTNLNAFVKIIFKAFQDYRVSLEVSEENENQNSFALEFKDDENKALFKVDLKEVKDN